MSTKRKRSSQKAEKPLVATTIKTIGGVNVTLSKRLEGLAQDDLVDAANTAITRLKAEQGPGGLVIITSFSHTAILGETEGATTDTHAQKHGVISTVASGEAEKLVEPESVGVSLKKVACFSIPSNLNLHKLNIAGIGAKSFVSPEYIRQIVDIIKQQQRPQELTTPESIANTIIQDITISLEHLFKNEADMSYRPYTNYIFDAIRNLIKSEVKKASKRNPTVLTFQHLSNAAQKNVTEKTHYKPLIDAVSYQFHADNLQSGAAFTYFTANGSCMMNKEYLRQDNVDEHIPGPDWHVNLHDKTGNLLIGNKPNPSDLSYMMDLITLVKILKRTDKVTTKDILDLLHENGIINVVFIDGGCNVFCGDDGMLACSGCHPSLDILCGTCKMSLKTHPRGGMKNKKPKTTKKKARIVRTVRGRRMRKSYKRYKTYKTYKRSKTYK